MKGITKTIPPSANTVEFVIHVNDEYDYRFKSEFRDDIIDCIKRAYYLMHKNDLSVYGVQSKDCKSYVTSKKDIKKDINASKIPPLS